MNKKEKESIMINFIFNIKTWIAVAVVIAIFKAVS